MSDGDEGVGEWFAEVELPITISNWDRVDQVLTDAGIETPEQLREAYERSPTIVWELARGIELVDSNQAHRTFVGWADGHDLDEHGRRTRGSLPASVMLEGIEVFMRGPTTPVWETTVLNARGETVEVGLCFLVAPKRGTNHRSITMAIPRALASSDDVFRRVVEDQTDLIARYTRGGVRTFVNDAYCRYFEQPREALVGTSFLDLVAEDDRPAVEAKLEALVPGGEPMQEVHKVVRPDGSIGWQEWTDCAVRTTDGGLEYQAIGRDVTRRIQDQNALRDALAEVSRLRDQLAQENRELRAEVRRGRAASEVIGESRAARTLRDTISVVAATDASVLILGETGSGKEVIANAIHAASDRHEGRLIKLNCAAMSASLVEAELFGHAQGAFTGAHREREGRFAMADGGTLFLDEVGELPADAQAKLLRVLQEGTFERVGSAESHQVDVRIIAATNRNLPDEIAAGRFRADLYYRLNVFPIHVPPLRERKDDIPALAQHFVELYGARHGAQVDSIDRFAMDRLTHYPWPGNVRQLSNVIERALITAEGRELAVPDLSFVGDRSTVPEAETGEDETLEGVQRRHIEQVLEETDWVIHGDHGAAAILGLRPSTLRSRMKRLGISRD